jgi:predicted HTH transcriptional regulator
MTEFDDLIKFENESTGVDFKAKQYVKHEDLLKDLIAMANANVTGDRHVIVGMKHLPDGNRKFWGINQNEFVDSATYHQLARENIEPEIHFDYSPYEFEGHLLGVLRVYNCNDQPYMIC